MMLRREISQLIDVVEERVFDRSAHILREENPKGKVGATTLLPPLSDELVLETIWHVLHNIVNISLLWRLRRVNHAWKESVARLVEWTALEVVRVDTTGMIRYLEERRECLPPLRERVEDELRSISMLLSDTLEDFASQSTNHQLMTHWSWMS